MANWTGNDPGGVALRRVTRAPSNPGHTPVGVAPAPPPNVPAPWAPPSADVGGSQPDYASLIANNPEYLAWKASAAGRRTNLASQRAAAIKALILRMGGLPSGATDAFGDADQATLDAAKNNPFSQQAQIGRSYQQGIEAMHRSLAARGALQSGELGYGQEQTDFGKAEGEFNANASFMDSLNSALNAYTGGVGDINAEEGGAVGAAQQYVYEHYKPTESHKANLVPDWQKYGFPVYLDTAGDYWRYDPTTGAPVKFTPGG